MTEEALTEHNLPEVEDMTRTVGIGIQDFAKISERDCFYIDKTGFIKEW